MSYEGGDFRRATKWGLGLVLGVVVLPLVLIVAICGGCMIAMFHGVPAIRQKAAEIKAEHSARESRSSSRADKEPDSEQK